VAPFIVSRPFHVQCCVIGVLAAHRPHTQEHQAEACKLTEAAILNVAGYVLSLVECDMDLEVHCIRSQQILGCLAFVDADCAKMNVPMVRSRFGDLSCVWDFHLSDFGHFEITRMVCSVHGFAQFYFWSLAHERVSYLNIEGLFRIWWRMAIGVHMGLSSPYRRFCQHFLESHSNRRAR
jgi:hypothetical protein